LCEVVDGGLTVLYDGASACAWLGSVAACGSGFGTTEFEDLGGLDHGAWCVCE